MLSYVQKIMFKKIKKKSGVSFIELIIALFLINVVFFSFVAFISMALKSSKKSQDVSRGNIVANSLLEDYISENRLNLEAQTGIKTFGNTNYNYDIKVQRISDYASDGKALYKVLISIKYDDFKNGVEEQRNVSLSTVIHGMGT